MSSSPIAPMRRNHVVPTHVHTPDMLLTVAGVSVSVRQFLLLLVGIALSYRCWLVLAFLAAFPGGPLGQVVRMVVALFPLGASLAFAFVHLAGRELDAWCVVLVRYMVRPRLLVWRSVRFQEPTAHGMISEEEQTHEITI
jgi:hypothetical protein